MPGTRIEDEIIQVVIIDDPDIANLQAELLKDEADRFPSVKVVTATDLPTIRRFIPVDPQEIKLPPDPVFVINHGFQGGVGAAVLMEVLAGQPGARVFLTADIVSPEIDEIVQANPQIRNSLGRPFNLNTYLEKLEAIINEPKEIHGTNH